MNVLASLKELAGLFREIVQRIESEYLLALLGIAVATIVTILLLPAEMSTDRYVVAIVALVGILIAVLFVLVTLARDRRAFDQQLQAKATEIERVRAESREWIDRKEGELTRLRSEFNGYRTAEAERQEQLRAFLARETAQVIILFGEQLLELDIGPANRRKIVTEGMASYLDRLIERETEDGRPELIAWLTILAAEPRQELERRGELQVVHAAGG
jgi:hypothetical protein